MKLQIAIFTTIEILSSYYQSDRGFKNIGIGIALTILGISIPQSHNACQLILADADAAIVQFVNR
jgi:hypothetical protein